MLRQAILDLALAGHYRLTIRRFMNIPEAVFNTWLSKEPEFEQELIKAEASCEMNRTNIVERAAKGGEVLERRTVKHADGRIETVEKFTYPNWQAALSLNERQNAAHWGKKDKIQHDHTGEVLIKTNTPRPPRIDIIDPKALPSPSDC